MPARTVLRIAVGVSVVLLAGCSQTTAGTPRAAEQPADSSLGELLLDDDQINSIMGASGMQSAEAWTAMADNSDEVAEPECLGALYNAQEAVYADSGWTEVVDQIADEPGETNTHWVQQSAVRFESETHAKDFFEESKTSWLGCIGETVHVSDDDGNQFTWLFEGIEFDGDSVSQVARQTDIDDWECQHVMKVAADLVVEASACAAAIEDEAATIADGIVANAR